MMKKYLWMGKLNRLSNLMLRIDLHFLLKERHLFDNLKIKKEVFCLYNKKQKTIWITMTSF